MVADGVTNSKEMMQHLKIYVKDELFKGEPLPPSNNRRFYPKRKAVVNHMYLTTVKLRYDRIDQVNVTKLIEQWKEERPNEKFFFRPYASVKADARILEEAEATRNDQESKNDDGEVKVSLQTSNQRLLFIHQTPHQARLMKRYGNDLTLLDATYKTTRYALPLFFVVVKTNTDYQIVASFVTQDETTDAIAEPLSFLKAWNPEWNPKIFMVDNCAEEINAIESTFPSKCGLVKCELRVGAFCEL